MAFCALAPPAGDVPTRIQAKSLNYDSDTFGRLNKTKTAAARNNSYYTPVYSELIKHWT